MNIANPHTQKYYFSHPEAIAQAHEKYRLNNPEVFRVNNQKYRDKNKGIKVECPCGTTCEKLHLSVHKKSKKHLEFFAKNPSAVELNLKPPPVDFTKVLCVNCGRSKIECRKLPHAKIPPEGNTDLTATSS